MLPSAITEALSSPNPSAPVLAAALAHYGCQTGTVHVMRDGQLRLCASVNIPAQLLPVIETVPVGKGIAGLAAERREPISLCNLQTDTSGQARPNAKQTGVEGAVAVPMLVDGDLRGVFGIAKVTAYDWSDTEKAEILEIASELGRRIA
jgi:signal transduction protein with GAF and PtsI domain